VITVNDGALIVKFAFDVSPTVGNDALTTRMRTLDVAGRVGIQAWLPLFAALLNNDSHVLPG
jgi:hypothetical protein